MKLTFLGTGTSTGVPQIGCSCETCLSDDARDKRLRTSALLEIGTQNILLDCGPDFRQQILRIGSPRIDSLLVTHTHYDHLGGLDDLRPYCYRPGGFPIYCRKDVALDIHTRMPYCFGPHHYPGAPRFDINIIDTDSFMVGGLEFTPLPVYHTATLEIVGFRCGNLGYITDCKILPASTIRLLDGIDTLVINALRFAPHRSHMNLQEALSAIKSIGPRQTYLTHISHQLGRHANMATLLPDGVKAAYDGLSIKI